MLEDQVTSSAHGEPAPLHGTVASAAKIGAAVLGAIYVLGFAVVTIHLGRYHVVPFGLLRVQYLLAGLWLLTPLIGVALPLLWTAAVYHVGSGGATSGSRRQMLLLYLLRGLQAWVMTAGYIGVMVYLVLSVAPQLRQEWGPVDVAFIFRYSGLVFLYGVGSVLPVSIALLFWRWGRSSGLAEALQNGVIQVFLVSFAAVTFLSYVLHFSLNVYPRLPVVVGGGAPQPVVLLPLASIDARLSLNFAPVAAHSLVRQELLLETDKTYVVRERASGLVLVINKDMVGGVAFIPRNKGTHL